MNNKITPEQAFEAFQLLDSACERIDFGRNFLVTVFCNGARKSQQIYAPNIEWPVGVFQWPPPEPKWTIPTDEDARSRPACRVRDSTNHDWTEGGVLVYVDQSYPPEDYVFFARSECGSLIVWRYCEIEVHLKQP